jgi:hypothetical protein
LEFLKRVRLSRAQDYLHIDALALRHYDTQPDDTKHCDTQQEDTQ